MKRINFKTILCMVACGGALITILFTTHPGSAISNNVTAIDVSSFRDALHPGGNLSAALASPATAGRSITISTIVPCGALSIPADRTLEIHTGGGINNSGTLDVKGNLEAGSYRIFYGKGAVSGLRKSRPQWWGALADGAHDDTRAMQFAVRAGAAGSVILELTKGTYRLTGRIALPKMDVKIVGDGAIINKRNGGEIFHQTNRGQLFELDGVRFEGNAEAFRYEAKDSPLPWHDQQYEYRIHNCQFIQDRSTYAIWLRGAREGVISYSRFENNKGIYRAYSVGTDLISCNFKNTVYGVNEDVGSEGLKIMGGVSLGVGTYLWAHGNTVGTQIIGGMIDYCDKPVVLDSVADVIISGSYISSRTDEPAIRIQRTGGQQTDGIIITGNVLIQNTPALRRRQGADRVIQISNSDHVKISNNIIRGWSYIGIEYSAATGLEILDNTIEHNPRFPGRFAISALDDDPTVRIRGNRVSSPIKVSRTRDISNNQGFVTENKGKAKVENGKSSVVVLHGMNMTPADYDITVTPLSPAAAVAGWYVSEINKKTFTIKVLGKAKENTLFAWNARIGK